MYGRRSLVQPTIECRTGNKRTSGNVWRGHRDTSHQLALAPVEGESIVHKTGFAAFTSKRMLLISRSDWKPTQ